MIKGFDYNRDEGVNSSYFEIFLKKNSKLSLHQADKLEEPEIIQEEEEELNSEEVKKVKKMCDTNHIFRKNVLILMKKHHDKDFDYLVYCIQKSLNQVKEKKDYLKYFNLCNENNIFQKKTYL